MTVAAKERVATITGTFLAPGVSLNGRLYTKEAIGKAVARMQTAIEDGTAPPIAQLTSHGTDDVLQTVGRLTRVWQAEDGAGKFESDVPDTTAGRDLTALTKHGYVRNVSIAGRWLGDVGNVEHEGATVETADDLEVVRVDFVPKPGVAAARIDSVAMAEGAPTGDWRDDVIAEVAFAEADKEPYGDVTYADPGYQDDKKKRYPLDTEKHVRAAWSYINQQKNAAKYSSADLAKVKGRIKAALKKFGVTPEEAAELALNEDFPSAQDYGAWQMIPIDPDGDGDTDALVCPACGHVRPVTDPTLNPDADDDAEAAPPDDNSLEAKEPTMSEETTPTPAAGLSEADAAKIGAAIAGPLAAALAPALKEALAPAPAAAAPAPATPVAPAATTTEGVTETAPAETPAQMAARLKEELKAELIPQIVKEYGLPQRVGVVAGAVQPAAKALHEMSPSELHQAAKEVASRLIHPEVGSAAR